MLLKVKQVSTFREVQKISESVLRFYFSLGCFPLWPIAEQRGEMNPIPATKTIKRLYYYSVTVFYFKYKIFIVCNLNHDYPLFALLFRASLY